jgi:hypothetical protein
LVRGVDESGESLFLVIWIVHRLGPEK